MNTSLASTFGLTDPFTPAMTGATVQRVYDDLRRRIITLQLPPDTTLSRNELTETYEVSQTPIREAMQLLKQEGLVRIYPQSKTVVTRIDVPQIYEAHFLRVALETEVARRLAAEGNPQTVTRARSIIRMQEAVADDPDQLAIFQELDEVFHQTLFAGLERGGLHQLVRERSGHLERIRRLHLPDPTPDNRVETRFEADGAGTLMTMRMTLPDNETRTAMLASGMEHGMAASYDRIETLFEPA